MGFSLLCWKRSGILYLWIHNFIGNKKLVWSFESNLLILGEIKSAYVSIASTVYNLRQLLLQERHYFVQFSALYNFLYSRGATAVAREDKNIVHAKKKENVFFIPLQLFFNIFSPKYIKLFDFCLHYILRHSKIITILTRLAIIFDSLIRG